MFCVKCEKEMEKFQMRVGKDGRFPEGYYLFNRCGNCGRVDGDYALLSVPWRNILFAKYDEKVLRLFFNPPELN